jgi:hypothetical protein
LSLKTILSGLSRPIKESMGQCTSAKDLWLKLEKTYQRKKEDIENQSIKIIKGKESPKILYCIIFKCNLENISNEDKESSDDRTKENLEDISNEGKELSKTLDCNISKDDDVEFFSTSEEENLEIVYVEFDGSYPMERIEANLLEIQKKVEDDIFRHIVLLMYMVDVHGCCALWAHFGT